MSEDLFTKLDEQKKKKINNNNQTKKTKRASYNQRNMRMFKQANKYAKNQINM